ncbi:VOC family protein [Streptomyces sp. NBC_01481]|uniref:VOC family protein n=1 Tax=Streptomyces sp. NBC_01481 TaxID=2975869 RepID=UPI00224D9BD4|nr:VOC family protein [Streptomyces sp. NBC_01481]MCX4584903.1 VOC family protein [Streptomyces sp. NBC_01481]
METTSTAPGVTSSHEVFGAPCWISLMARDLQAAQSFYGAVLGWTFRRARLGAAFRIAHFEGTPVAGIGALGRALRAPVTWTPYFAVADVDETAARIRERSATVAVGPLRFPVGRGALAADRDGAVFGIWEGQLVSNWQAWRKNAPAWLRLRTRDAFEAAIFYGEVLDWASERSGCCQVDYQEGEVVLHQHGQVLARLSSGAVGTTPDPLFQPRWHVHFPVGDVQATVEAALLHGGSVLGQGPAPYGVEATLRDPDGALFTVTSRPASSASR